MRRAKIAIVAAVPLLLAGLAGCGDDAAGSTNTGSSASAQENRQEQMLRYTECLREHGLDVEDPGGDGGGFALRIRGEGDGSDDTTREAMEACEELAPMRGGDLDDLRNDPEFQEAQLRFAECMRDHGVDMPDPDENGGVMIGADEDLPQETIEAAMEACEPLMSELRSKFEDGGE